MHKIRTVVAAALLLVGGANVQAQVTIVTTTSSEGMPHRYYDGGVSTWVDGAGAQYDAFWDTGGKHWAMPVYNFDLSPLSGKVLTSATLNLYVAALGGTPELRYSGQGSANVSYSQATGGSTLASISVSTPSWATYDVTAQVSEALNNGWSWLAFNIYIPGNNSGSFGGVLGSNPATISATVVPEPAHAALLGVIPAVLFLALRRRSES